jgi:hypothetical protein
MAWCLISIMDNFTFNRDTVVLGKFTSVQKSAYNNDNNNNNNYKQQLELYKH